MSDDSADKRAVGQSKRSLDEKAGLPIELRQLNNPVVLRRATHGTGFSRDQPAGASAAVASAGEGTFEIVSVGVLPSS